jgi:hypothetical protein
LLISIPQDLSNISLGLPNNFLDQVNPMFNKLNISIAVVLGLGMISLILLIFNDTTTTTYQQYYVAEKIKEKEAELNHLTQNKEEYNLILQKADQIINGKEDLKIINNKILSAVCKEFEASQGAIYKVVEEDGKRLIELISSFAYPIADSKKIVFEFGEGLVGQAAKEGKLLIYILYLKDISKYFQDWEVLHLPILSSFLLLMKEKL